MIGDLLLDLSRVYSTSASWVGWEKLFYRNVGRLWMIQTGVNQMKQDLDCTGDDAKSPNRVLEAYHWSAGQFECGHCPAAYTMQFLMGQWYYSPLIISLYIFIGSE